MGHVLVIGGTGMLRGVCLELTRRGHHVTVVGRSQEKLNQLVLDANELGFRVHPVSSDYADEPRFAADLQVAVSAQGDCDAAVCWVHSTAPRAMSRVASILASPPRESRPHLVHIVGCEAHHPTIALRSVPATPCVPTVRCTRVVLGWVVERGRSRWLSDEEICAGALRALDGDADEVVIGSTAPWEMRP